MVNSELEKTFVKGGEDGRRIYCIRLTCEQSLFDNIGLDYEVLSNIVLVK